MGRQKLAEKLAPPSSSTRGLRGAAQSLNATGPPPGTSAGARRWSPRSGAAARCAGQAEQGSRGGPSPWAAAGGYPARSGSRSRRCAPRLARGTGWRRSRRPRPRPRRRRPPRRRNTGNRTAAPRRGAGGIRAIRPCRRRRGPGPDAARDRGRGGALPRHRPARGRAPWLLMAGDSGQTVRPTGFEWGPLNDLLVRRVRRPEEFHLEDHLRCPSRIAEVIEPASQRYTAVEKEVRPTRQRRQRGGSMSTRSSSTCTSPSAPRRSGCSSASTRRKTWSSFHRGTTLPIGCRRSCGARCAARRPPRGWSTSRSACSIRVVYAPPWRRRTCRTGSTRTSSSRRAGRRSTTCG